MQKTPGVCDLHVRWLLISELYGTLVNKFQFACALVAYLWAVRHSSQQISIPVTQLPKKGRRKQQHDVPKHHYIS